MNNISEERMRILRLLEEGKLNADQAMQFLAALNGVQEVSEPPTASQPKASASVVTEPEVKSGKQPRWFKVIVKDLATDKTKVYVSLPMSLVNWGLKVGGQFEPKIAGLDFNELYAALDGSEDGRFVDVIDEEDGEHVQIFLE